MSAPLLFTSPLPPDDLFIESMTVTEGLSQLGLIRLNLLSPKPSLMPQDLLGKPVGVTTLSADGKRHFHGHVTRFAMGTPRGRYYAYQAEVRCWPWFLTRTRDCRIFQDMTVPDIVKKVLDDHPALAHMRLNLFRTYRPWTYCVQYRESDFQFIARLLEHEGIYWYIEHHHDRHDMVLVDSLSAHDPVQGEGTQRYIEDPQTAPPDQTYVSNWTFSQEVRTGKVALTSYDFERPATSLLVEANHSRPHDQADLENFDFQGDYLQSADGQQLAGDQLDEEQWQHHCLQGQTNAMNLEVGRTFKLDRHPREDQNGQYLITQIQIEAKVGLFDAGEAGSAFHCTFQAIPSAQQFRPPRVTPKPFVQGPQTAVVVGPSGEEIFTDKYGRVKVQFHWDRRGKKDEKSSCWVRVSHPWAGQNFGAIHIPRIGQEVVVDFLEGDPDQPLITGRVYNAQQMPPWDLPANATQSGILTRSSKGGAYANANAIRFEDKKGSEQLWIHAEKNQDIEVENDETHWVGNDRTKKVDHDEKVVIKNDRVEDVGNNETITIGADRKETVGANENITIGVNRTESVGANEDITIGASRTETVGASESITIGASRSITVGASQSETIAASLSQTVGGSVTQTVGGSVTQTVAGGVNIVTPAAMTVMAAGGFTVLAPGGTKTIDSFFDQTGGKSMQAFGMTMAVAGAATAISGVSWQYQAAGFGWTGFKNEVVNCAITHTGVKMDTATLDMSNGGVEFKFKALFFVG